MSEDQRAVQRIIRALLSVSRRLATIGGFFLVASLILYLLGAWPGYTLAFVAGIFAASFMCFTEAAGYGHVPLWWKRQNERREKARREKAYRERCGK